MNKSPLCNNLGFTLIELLVVMVLMGGVTMAILGVYQTSLRTSSGEEDIVEMQQQMRVALDKMIEDIGMAGYLVKQESSTGILWPPLHIARQNELALRTASAFNTSATIASSVDFDVPDNNDTYTIAVMSNEELDLFDTGGSTIYWAKVYRVETNNSAFYNSAGNRAYAFRTLGKTYGVNGGNPPQLRIQAQSFTPGDKMSFKRGDVIVRTVSGVTSGFFPDDLPEIIYYNYPSSLVTNPFSISRATGRFSGGNSYTNMVTTTYAGPIGNTAIDPSTVYPRITATFSYLLDDNRELPNVLSVSDRMKIRAVRVTLTGVSRPTAQHPQGKTRQLSTVIALRNR